MRWLPVVWARVCGFEYDEMASIFRVDCPGGPAPGIAEIWPVGHMAPRHPLILWLLDITRCTRVVLVPSRSIWMELDGGFARDCRRGRYDFVILC